MKRFIKFLLLLTPIILCLFGCSKELTNTIAKNEESFLNIPYSITSSISFVTKKADVMNKYGKPEVVRKQSDYSYEIRTLKDKSKLFVFYGNDENVIDSWRLNKLLNRNDFDNIKIEASKESDIREIDPYFQIFEYSEKRENGISEHRVDDNGLIKVEYKKTNNVWVVSSILYEKQDPSGFLSKLLPEDKSMISK